MSHPTRDQLNKLTAAIPGVVYQFRVKPSGEWAFLYLSPGITSLFEVSPEDACTDHAVLTDCILPEDRASHRASVELATRTMAPWIHEHRIRPKSGRIKWIRAQAIPEQQADGSVIWNGVLIDITDHKIVEEALREQEQLYRTVTDHGQALIWMAGLDKGCFYFNRPWLDFTGRTLAQEAGNGWSDGVHPEDLQRCLETYLTAFDRQEKFSMTYRLRRHDGEYRWLLDDGAPRFDTAGQFAGYVGHCLDITERKRVEQKLAESERLFHLFMDTLPAAAFIKDQDGTLLYANRYLIEIMGELDWKGKSTRDLFPPEVAEAMIADDRRSIAVGHVLTEERVMGADGQLKTYQTHKFRIPRQDEPPLLGGIALDISERKRLEDQIRLLAFYDPLTSLPNRRLLRDRLGQTIAACRRTQCSAALLMIDLDNFKPLNDALGHAIGDQLLVETASRITSCVREVDTVARLGGDEFVVVLGELDGDKHISARQAEHVAEKIRATLCAPYRLKSTRREGPALCEHSCSASIGITMLGDDEDSQDEIIDRADAAMYQAKASGRNAVRFFNLRT